MTKEYLGTVPIKHEKGWLYFVLRNEQGYCQVWRVSARKGRDGEVQDVDGKST